MKLIRNRILIKKDSADTKSKSGLLYLPTSKDNSINTGEVIGVADTITDIKIGDRIIYSRLCGKLIDAEQNTVLLEYNDIQCKISDDNIHAIGGRMLIVQDKEEMKTSSGIFLFSNEKRITKENIGTILSIGEKCKKYKIGDKIGFSMYAGRNVTWKDDNYVIMLESEPFFKILDENIKIQIKETQDSREIMTSSGQLLI